jgi:glycosyltransferase involved in cell wall biosynthesis
MKKVSAIICTHNPREEFLNRVLAALRAQTLPMADWELLLIDNASQDPLSCRFDLSWHPHARHVREDELGLTPARLRGIREAVADVLVFVDDDTILAPDYLEKALDVGAQWPFVGAWGGSCLPEYQVPLPSWVGDQVWRLTVVEVKTDVWSNLREGYATLPCGAGLCFRRSVGQAYLKRCQSQRDTALTDRKGKSLAGYGDMDLCHSALDLGLGTGKSTKLRLTHLIPASRLTLDYFVRHAEGDAASMLLFRASRGLPITPPRPTSRIGSLRWFFHRLTHHVPREQYEIAKAHQRGLEKGWKIVQHSSAKHQGTHDAVGQKT